MSIKESYRQFKLNYNKASELLMQKIITNNDMRDYSKYFKWIKFFRITKEILIMFGTIVLYGILINIMLYVFISQQLGVIQIIADGLVFHFIIEEGPKIKEKYKRSGVR